MFAVITVMMLLVATGKHSTTAAQRASWPTRKVLSSGQSMLMAVEMEMEEMSKVTRMDCVQRAGDVVYVPPRWLHNTWNVVPSVSISFVRLEESSP